MVSLALCALARSIEGGKMTTADARIVQEGLPNVMYAIALRLRSTMGEVFGRAENGIPASDVIAALYTMGVYE